MTLTRTEMKRGKPMSRGTTPMKRGGPIMAKATKVTIASLPLYASGAGTKAPARRKSTLKTNRPKMTKIRESAKNEECTLRFPCCNYRIDTTVLCHRNGAGAGMKAHDTDAAYGCYACHMVLDGHFPRPEGFLRDMMLAQFDVAVEATRRLLEAKGLIAVREPSKNGA